MTRALIIGSSHVGALKRAAPAFAERHPEIELDFFGMRGAVFLTAKIEKGEFLPNFRSEQDRKLSEKINGATSISLDGYDHVLLIGYRFGFVGLAGMLRDHDILEGARSGKTHVMGAALLNEVVDTLAPAQVADALARLGEARGLTLALAPYPASSLTTRAETFEMAAILQDFWAHPEALRLFDRWLGHLRAGISAGGHHFLEQPASTVDGPYATRAPFAVGASDDNTGQLARDDHRHMNADYGLLMLEEFAEKVLLAAPEKATRKTA